MDGEYEEHIGQMEEVHQRQLQELESSFQQKMQVEVGRSFFFFSLFQAISFYMN